MIMEATADHVLIEDLIARFLSPPEFRRGLVSGRVGLPDEKSSEPVDSDLTPVVSPSEGK